MAQHDNSDDDKTVERPDAETSVAGLRRQAGLGVTLPTRASEREVRRRKHEKQRQEKAKKDAPAKKAKRQAELNAERKKKRQGK